MGKVTQRKLHKKNYTTFHTQQNIHNFSYTTPESTEKSHTLPMTPQGAKIRPEYLQSWADYIDAKPRTIEAYTKNLRGFYGFLQESGDMRPTRETVIKYRDELTKDHKPATVQSYITAVKLFFQWTEQAGIYPNIAAHIKGPKIDRTHKKDYLSATQAAQILKGIDRTNLQGLRDYAIITTMITTGARAVEITRANIEDLRTVGGTPVLYLQGKGRDERSEYVKLAPEAEGAIREYLKARGSDPDAAPLFASISNKNAGGRMSTRSVSRLVKDHMRAAGYDSSRLTAHSLRHTAATLNLLNGGTLEETQQLLRHASINTTTIYSHALTREKNNSEARISAAIFQKERED